MTYRPLKENEINFAVEAYGQTLKELQKYENIKIIPTERTLEAFRNLLKINYQNEIYSYVVTNNNFIIAYALIGSDTAVFDTKDFNVYLLTIYIEPDYRRTDVLNNLMEYTRMKLKESGASRVYFDMPHRIVSKRLMKKLGIQENKSFCKMI